MPQIQISYLDAGGEHQLYLSIGEDGGPILTDTVEAVG